VEAAHVLCMTIRHPMDQVPTHDKYAQLQAAWDLLS